MAESTVENTVIKVRKRPWYEWLLWALWAVILLFILQNAIGSGAEMESRAAVIFWISFAVWFLAGAVVWFIRRQR
jgi:hypothetical protein